MKKNTSGYFLIVLLLAISFAAGFFVTKSRAQTAGPIGFSGQLVSWLYCDCSDSFILYYAPNDPLDNSFPGGALSYSPDDTETFQYGNMFTPGVWHLGLYLPEVQGCWMWYGYTCAPLPVIGHEIMVGTSGTPITS